MKSYFFSIFFTLCIFIHSQAQAKYYKKNDILLLKDQSLVRVIQNVRPGKQLRIYRVKPLGNYRGVWNAVYVTESQVLEKMVDYLEKKDSKKIFHKSNDVNASGDLIAIEPKDFPCSRFTNEILLNPSLGELGSNVFFKVTIRGLFKSGKVLVSGTYVSRKWPRKNSKRLISPSGKKWFIGGEKNGHPVLYTLLEKDDILFPLISHPYLAYKGNDKVKLAYFNGEKYTAFYRISLSNFIFKENHPLTLKETRFARKDHRIHLGSYVVFPRQKLTIPHRVVEMDFDRTVTVENKFFSPAVPIPIRDVLPISDFKANSLLSLLESSESFQYEDHDYRVGDIVRDPFGLKGKIREIHRCGVLKVECEDGYEFYSSADEVTKIKE